VSLRCLLAVGAVLVLIVGCSTSVYLDNERLEQEIEAWFQDGAQITTDVTCPANEPIKQGDVFNCTAHTPDGLTLTVQVTQTDGSGTVSWQQV
jgi:hypothetical protein